MPRYLLLDCSSGISGDMTVAALLDLGADRAALDTLLASLPLDGAHVHVSRVKKSGLDCCDFDVHLDAAHENHDHDMAYLHGHDHHHHDHDHDHHDHHDHDHGHHHDHPHEHRGLREIEAILRAATMTPSALALALRVFRILAEAESKAHGVPPEEVHFHEVGAIDSIIDIAAFAVLYDSLRLDAAFVPSLSEGRGTVRCQHGILPIPVPAVVHIAEAHALPLRQTEVEGELVTPTGAAIAAAIRSPEPPPQSFRIAASGLGAGKRDYACAGFLRAMLIEPAADAADPSESVCRLECNLDDATGEELGFALERLMDAGARDAFYTPVFMKKNRPGWLLTVLCAPDEADRFTALLFRHTTTLGVRRALLDRAVLPRSFRTVPTPWGDVSVKEARVGDDLRLHPEYEDIARIAREHDLPLRTVSQAILTSNL